MIKRSRPAGLIVLAILQILAGIIYLIAGLGVGLVTGVLGGFFSALGGAIGLVFIALGVTEFVVSWGYLAGKGWARLAGLILAGIGISCRACRPCHRV